MPHRRVAYPPEYQDIAVRDNLLLSQTDVTENPAIGLWHAIAAYDQGLTPEVRQHDPTAAGEAAAKAGFRSEQLGQGTAAVEAWFNRSYEALPTDDPRSLRERVATYLLHGRATALRIGKMASAGIPVDDEDVWVARSSFANGSLYALPRDPYRPMLYGHWATFEAMDGSSRDAARLALSGIGSAIRAREERANTPHATLTSREKLQKQAKFILKQNARNLLALGLAASRPLEKSEAVQQKRRALSLKSLS